MFIIRFLIILIIFMSANTANISGNSDEGAYVVLIHGMKQSSRSMSKIAAHLNELGYTTIKIDYPSTKHSIEDSVKYFILEKLSSLDPKRKVHIIGYSLGGIITRYIIDNHKPKNLGNVVLIGSPNNGSEIAGILQSQILANKIFGPALKDIQPESSFWKSIKSDVSEHNVGVIAGDFSMNPITSLFIFNGKSDGTVSLNSTMLKGMKDF